MSLQHSVRESERKLLVYLVSYM